MNVDGAKQQKSTEAGKNEHQTSLLKNIGIEIYLIDLMYYYCKSKTSK